MSNGLGYPPGTGPYTVLPGDTAAGLAQRCGVMAEDIEFLNPNVDMQNLQVGQELRIPTRNCPWGLVPYVVKRDDTFESIAAQSRTIPRLLGHFNPGINPMRIRTGQVLCVPAKYDDLESSGRATVSHPTGRLRGLRPRAKGG